MSPLTRILLLLTLESKFLHPILKGLVEPEIRLMVRLIAENFNVIMYLISKVLPG